MFKILGLYMLEECRKFEGKDATGMVLTAKGLKELAVISAGLKALNTFEACKGIEELRLCCGGNIFYIVELLKLKVKNWVMLLQKEIFL